MARPTIEKARELHERYPNDEYFTALAEGTLPAFYLRKFVFFRDNYSDELPLEDVSMKTEAINGRTKVVYKCQGNFTGAVMNWLRYGLKNEDITNPTLIEKIKAFVDSDDLEFQIGDPRNVERLARVNGLIGNVIEYFSPMVPPEQRTQPSPLQTP
jgi:hypothetical protein